MPRRSESWRRATSLALLDFRDLDGEELAVSRRSWRTWRGVSPSSTPAMLFAARVDRDVLIRTHQSARVTRTTSSSVVVAGEDLLHSVVADARSQRARVALEIVLGRAVVNHRAHRVVDLDELVDAGAARVAVIVGRRAVERRRVRRVDVQKPAFVLARAIRNAQGGVDYPHEALREHADQARRQQERLDAHVAQPRHRADGRVRVQRRQHEVTRQASLHGDLRRLEVADLADHHDVGILAQDRA